MLTGINPKFPMRNMGTTKDFYINRLGFSQFGGDFDGYLMVQKDAIQIHFLSLRHYNQRIIMVKSILERIVSMIFTSPC